MYSERSQAYCIKPDGRIHYIHKFSYFHASGDFHRLLITFASSLDPDQDRQNVGPDLDQNCLKF